MNRLPILLFCFLLFSCETTAPSGSIAQWKQEIIDTERAFSKLAQAEGIPTAFLTYAADSATILRGKRLISGRPALEQYFQPRPDDGSTTSLSWVPDFVDVAASGDLGYTYGQYVYTRTDSSGVVQRDTGVFHTVWKRQGDGGWKFVWD